MTSLTVYSQNIEDRILERETQDNVVFQNADVVLLVEGYSASVDKKLLKEAVERLESFGYRSWCVPYDDDDGRLDAHGYIVLVRDWMMGVSVEIMRAGGRNFPLITVLSDFPQILGVHLDDRTIERRFRQALSLIGQIQRPPLIVGDFNSDYRDGFMGRMLNQKLVSWLIDAVSPLEISPSQLRSLPMPSGLYGRLRRKAGRLASLARRLRDMTSAENEEVLELFGWMGYVDADHERQVTRPLVGESVGVQLDRVLYCSPSSQVEGFQLVRGGSSDHYGMRFVVS